MTRTDALAQAKTYRATAEDYLATGNARISERLTELADRLEANAAMEAARQ